MDGISNHLVEELTKVGVYDVNTALANTLKEMENASSNDLGVKDTNQRLGEVVAK